MEQNNKYGHIFIPHGERTLLYLSFCLYHTCINAYDRSSTHTCGMNGLLSSVFTFLKMSHTFEAMLICMLLSPLSFSLLLICVLNTPVHMICRVPSVDFDSCCQGLVQPDSVSAFPLTVDWFWNQRPPTLGCNFCQNCEWQCPSRGDTLVSGLYLCELTAVNAQCLTCIYYFAK